MEYPDFSINARTRGDKRGIEYNQGTLVPLTINLSTAQTLKEYQFQGDVIYCDRDSTGVLRFKIDMAWPKSFPLAANGAIRGLPYKSFLLDWDAQPGLVANLWCGYGVDIVAPNQDITSIGSITNAVEMKGPRTLPNGPAATDLPLLVREIGFKYGSAYTSGATMIANTPLTILAAGSNTNGLIIHSATFIMRTNTTGSVSALLAKSSAPVNVDDGVAFASPDYALGTAAGEFYMSGKMNFPMYIPSGLGLYTISNIETTMQKVTVQYSLL